MKTWGISLRDSDPGPARAAVFRCSHSWVKETLSFRENSRRHCFARPSSRTLEETAGWEALDGGESRLTAGPSAPGAAGTRLPCASTSPSEQRDSTHSSNRNSKDRSVLEHLFSRIPDFAARNPSAVSRAPPGGPGRYTPAGPEEQERGGAGGARSQRGLASKEPRGAVL